MLVEEEAKLEEVRANISALTFVLSTINAELDDMILQAISQNASEATDKL